MENTNYATKQLIKAKIRGLYNALPEYNSSYTENDYDALAQNIYDLYKSQLTPIDNFNYKICNDMLSKMDVQREKYLKRNSFSENVSTLTSDFNFINTFINSYYDDYCLVGDLSC